MTQRKQNFEKKQPKTIPRVQIQKKPTELFSTIILLLTIIFRGQASESDPDEHLAQLRNIVTTTKTKVWPY